MGNNGAPRADVLRALKAHKVFVGVDDEAGNLYAIEHRDFLEKKVLTDPVPMWILNEFKRKLGIPIHHFWHPEEAESQAKPEDEKAPS